MSFEDMMKEPRDENQTAIVVRSEYNDEGTWESAQPDQEPIEHKEVSKPVKCRNENGLLIPLELERQISHDLFILTGTLLVLNEINYDDETHSKDAEKFAIHPEIEPPALHLAVEYLNEPYFNELLNNPPDTILTTPEPPSLPKPQLYDLFTGTPHTSNNKNLKYNDLEKEVSVKETVINELKQILNNTEKQTGEYLSTNIEVLKKEAFKLNYIEAQIAFLIERLQRINTIKKEEE